MAIPASFWLFTQRAVAGSEHLLLQSVTIFRSYQTILQINSSGIRTLIVRVEGLHADHYRHCPIATMWPDLMKSHYIGKIRNFVGGNFWRLQLLFGKNIMPLGKFSLKLLMADYFKKSSHLVTLYCKHNFTATQRTTRLWHLVAF